jgi:hypothetical protein
VDDKYDREIWNGFLYRSNRMIWFVHRHSYPRRQPFKVVLYGQYLHTDPQPATGFSENRRFIFGTQASWKYLPASCKNYSQGRVKIA